jgi:hypothetical protein
VNAPLWSLYTRKMCIVCALKDTRGGKTYQA